MQTMEGKGEQKDQSELLREMLKVGLDGEDNVEKFLASDDPEKRKLARRIKMERRLKASQAPVPDGKESETRDLTATENQMNKSTSKIEELLEDSQRSIINVRVAAIKNEMRRQKKEEERKAEIDALIGEEANLAREKFEEINSKWEVISKKNDPLDIHEGTERQRDDCVALLEQKDVIIDNLKSRLKRADQEFYEELTQQNNYINILSDRINDQISLISDCHREELQNLHRVIIFEKDKVLNEKVTQWGSMAEMKETLELENISKRCNYLQEYEDQIDSMLIEQHELMRSQKMEMEARLNKLTLEDNRLRSTALINTELLHYNIHVLQKRQEESRIMKAQQKRIANKLQEATRRLHQRQNEKLESLRNEKTHILEEMEKLITNIKIVEERLGIMRASGDRKYFQLWDYNQEEAERMVSKLIHQDKKFHNDLLLIPWSPPKFSISKESMPSYKQAKMLLGETKGACQKNLTWQTIKTTEMDKLTYLVIENLRKTAEYLADDHLQQFLHPFSPQAQSIISVHTIFEMLGMRKAEDIDYLMQCFWPYMECRQCEEGKKGEKTVESSEPEDKEVELSSRDTTKVVAVHNENEKSKYSKPASHICMIPGHTSIISFVHVAQALKDCVKKLNVDKKWGKLIDQEDEREPKQNFSRLLSTDDVEKFWKIPDVLPESKKLLWRCLLGQMKEYYKIILRRNYLKEEIKKTERKNQEMRRLLMRYLQKDYVADHSLQI